MRPKTVWLQWVVKLWKLAIAAVTQSATNTNDQDGIFFTDSLNGVPNADGEEPHTKIHPTGFRGFLSLAYGEGILCAHSNGFVLQCFFACSSLSACTFLLLLHSRLLLLWIFFVRIEFPFLHTHFHYILIFRLIPPSFLVAFNFYLYSLTKFRSC